MSVKVLFEIGHEASLKSKPTSDGFTHDWELFVKGCDTNDISHFVEKVVFNLHDSFPRPKRVIKEPPYSLKESGYAGFVLPIDIYVKNRDEPKKITFNYDLDLQQTGPAIYKTQKEKFIFTNPSEDFRRKLLKGGGILVSDSISNIDDRSRDSFKLSGNGDGVGISVGGGGGKKYKQRPDEMKGPSSTFANLFGIPITKTSTKVSPDPKSKSSPSTLTKPQMAQMLPSKMVDKGGSMASKDKGEKDKSKHNKHNSPHRDRSDGKESKKNDDKYDRRDDKKKDRNHSKDRESKSKEKSVKRPPSPKRSPKRMSPTRMSISKGDENKMQQMRHLDSGQTGNVLLEGKSSSSSGKKLKKEKKEKSHDKERDKKEHKKDMSDKGIAAMNKFSMDKMEISATTKNIKDRDISSNLQKDVMSKDKMRDVLKMTGPEVPNYIDNIQKLSTQTEISKRSEKHEKDVERKHKHKKKDKNKKDEHKEKDHGGGVISTIGGSKDKKKDRSDKLSGSKPGGGSSREENMAISSPAKSAKLLLSSQDIKSQQYQSQQQQNDGPSSKKTPTPLDKLISELHGSSSDSDIDSPPSASDKNDLDRVGTENSNSSIPDVVISKPVDDNVTTISGKASRKSRGERKSSNVEKEEKKRKRKTKDSMSDSGTIGNLSAGKDNLSPNKMDPPSKIPRRGGGISNLDDFYKNGDNSNIGNSGTPSGGNNSNDEGSSYRGSSTTTAATIISNASTTPTGLGSGGGGGIGNIASGIVDRNQLSVDYMSELKDLQHKIMTLQDNNELQQVVEMIAATGRYEITSKTFDFDLCALDKHTVQRLQEFFATS